MKVYGTEITEAQQQAAQAAMSGRFTYSTICFALARAGVKNPVTHPPVYVIERAADRLLQRARKAGQVRHLVGRQWESVA